MRAALLVLAILVEIFFFGLIAPALIMAAPFKPLLWWLGLMHAPGWFAWPRPLGFVLVYAAIVRLRRRRALR